MLEYLFVNGSPETSTEGGTLFHSGVDGLTFPTLEDLDCYRESLELAFIGS